MVVYKIENTENGKIYIGSTNNYQKRKRKHKRKLRKFDHYNNHLQRSWNKYGSRNFEFSILEIVKEEKDLLDCEQYYLDKLEPEYNIASNAIAPMRGKSHSKEAKKIISKKQSGENNNMYGKHHCEEAKRKMSEATKGGERSEKTKEKISKTLKDKEKINKRLSGKSHPMYGKHHSKKTKRKMSEAHKGREYSEKTRQKMGEAQKGEKNGNVKLTKKKVKIIKYLLDGENFTLEEIAKMYGVALSTIGQIKIGGSWSHISIN